MTEKRRNKVQSLSKEVTAVKSSNKRKDTKTKMSDCRQMIMKNLLCSMMRGYGDLTLEVQGPLLDLLDAPRRAGLCVTSSDLLAPRKSVTAILGVSDGEVEKTKRSCLGCPAQGSCQYRKAGGHCGIS